VWQALGSSIEFLEYLLTQDTTMRTLAARLEELEKLPQ
jgi:hypothetical protein